VTSLLSDSFGRIATDLRVSVTDRCNLRCTYCMPAEGLDWLPNPALLTDDEMSRLISVAVRLLGITAVRFTGGEPLIRRGLPALISRTAALEPRPEISLTTNGIGLARMAGSLAAAGLDRLNVSLDSGSVTRPFCGTCDRVRLTADGQVRNCLFASAETDLRAALRSGASDDQLAALWRSAVAAKLPGHGINNPGFLQPARPMSAIGG
jgi:cyclic pyranopterin phosphate synthase